jgi:hypothetical protein
LTLDQSGPDECVNGPANRGSAPLHPGCHLVERRRLLIRNGRQESALLALRLGRSGVTAKLFD